MNAETPPQCQQSRREDGGHAWNFDGDDPYIVCSYCDQMQDAHSGRVIRKGRPSQEMAEREAETRARIEELREQLGPADEDPREAVERMRDQIATGATRPPMSADTTKSSSDETAVATVAGALSRAAIANGTRLRGLRAPLARAALEAAVPHITRQNAASLRALGHEAAAVALERAAKDLEDEGATE